MQSRILTIFLLLAVAMLGSSLASPRGDLYKKESSGVIDKDASVELATETVIVNEIQEDKAEEKVTVEEYDGAVANDISRLSEDLIEKQEPESKVMLFQNIVQNLIRGLGPAEPIMSIAQIFFYHAFVLAVFYLVNLIKGFVVDLINLKRTPLLIYKEVDDYHHKEAEPAPVLPAPHHDYGYMGGFKTPQKEEIKYFPFFSKQRGHGNKDHNKKPKTSSHLRQQKPKGTYQHKQKPKVAPQHEEKTKVTYHNPKPAPVVPAPHHDYMRGFAAPKKEDIKVTYHREEKPKVEHKSPPKPSSHEPAKEVKVVQKTKPVVHGGSSYVSYAGGSHPRK